MPGSVSASCILSLGPFPCPSLRTPPPIPLAEAKPRTNFLLGVVSFYAKAKNSPLIKNSDINV